MSTYESVVADVPRSLRPGRSLDDKIFRGTAISIGVVVLVTVGAIGLFLGLKLIPTIQHYGWGCRIDGHTCTLPQRLDSLYCAVQVVVAFPMDEKRI